MTNSEGQLELRKRSRYAYAKVFGTWGRHCMFSLLDENDQKPWFDLTSR
jgi:hypothetical protein